MTGTTTTDEVHVETPAYVSALDKVVARADEGLELISSTETLEAALGKLSQLAAVYRASDVYNILKQRESALLAGALTRSLVEGALAEDWYASRPLAEAPRSATLAGERQNIADSVAVNGLSVPNLHRWNNPIADQRFATAPKGPGLPNVQASISKNAGTTLERTLLLPAPLMDVLGMCSHVNHAATWLTAGDDSREIGVSASPAFAAILAQSAGMAAASIRGFNHQGPVLDLIAAATASHEFDVLAPLGRPKLIENLRPKQPASGQQPWLEDEPTLAMDGLLKEIRDESLTVWRLVNDAPNPFAGPNPEINLTSALPYLAARDLLLLTIRSTFEGCSPLMAPTGARMLLEQGSELAWRFSDPSDSELLKRYQAHMDDATDRKKALESSLLTRTSSTEAVESLLFPRGRGNFAIDTRRMPNSQSAVIPSPQEHLSELSLGVAEPYWGLAYKLLTQAAHATPLGLLHAVARRDNATGEPALSHEMTALSLDTACTGAALVMRSLAPLIANQAGLPSPKDWLIELFDAVSKVHFKAQQIHFLG
jgi:hypothetical protein